MARRNTLVEALRTQLGDVLSFQVPSGGMALWCRVARRVNVETWVKRCEEAGVRFHAGGQFAFDERPLPYVRLGFAPLAEKQLQAAVRTMAGALR